MRKSISLVILYLTTSSALAEASLTDVETRWISAGLPVLNYAKTLKLPFDIIVQPESKRSDVPIAMGFEEGRCKLVLSMRGNPTVEAILDPVAPAQRKMVIETMMAHEMAHCWRYLQGAWHQLPAGMVEASHTEDEAQTLTAEQEAMRETRREEGYADLAGLAWAQEHHPGDYAQIYHWLAQLRDDQPVAGSYHDTRVWVRLAKDAAVFDKIGPPFEKVLSLWKQGLLHEN